MIKHQHILTAGFQRASSRHLAWTKTRLLAYGRECVPSRLPISWTDPVEVCVALPQIFTCVFECLPYAGCQEVVGCRSSRPYVVGMHPLPRIFTKNDVINGIRGGPQDCRFPAGFLLSNWKASSSSAAYNRQASKLCIA